MSLVVFVNSGKGLEHLGRGLPIAYFKTTYKQCPNRRSDTDSVPPGPAHLDPRGIVAGAWGGHDFIFTKFMLNIFTDRKKTIVSEWPQPYFKTEDLLYLCK